jgi:hypothetical protein
VHPYRSNQTLDRVARAPSEEVILYGTLCAIGAIPIALDIANGGAFGVQATIGLVMTIAGAIGLADAARRRGRPRPR